MKRFGKRKAFIYALEICAQLICFVCLQHHLPTLVVSFCDNTAGLSALLRGYGKDENINGLLLVTWRLLHHYGWHTHFQWVASQNNISDKISRHQIQWALDLGWTQIHPDMDPLYKILAHCASNTAYAHGDALQDLLCLRLL